MPEKPKVVCLCGSTRFKQAFIEANFRETMAGRIVLSVGLYSHADADVYVPTPAEKAALDELHLRKIDLADEVLVLNCRVPCCDFCGRWHFVGQAELAYCACRNTAARVRPYVGESTSREIAYAVANNKPVRYLNAPE